MYTCLIPPKAEPTVDAVAIRRMQEEESRVTAWQAAIAKGTAQLDRGEGAPYTPELMERLTQSAIETLHNGQPVDPDVIP